MTERQARYAVYFVPARDSALHRFGSAVLGYDCHTGSDMPFPDDIGLDRETWWQMTEEPRRYGFHATLKAPFRLANGCSESELVRAFGAFAARGNAPIRIVPDIRLLGTFTAIVPREPCPPLAALADRCTTEFDAFRAPMPAAERARRAAGLSERLRANLDRWGYPYVFADFRFHMTLTGRLAPDRQGTTLATLRRMFARACGDESLAIDRLGLVRQDDEGARFRVIDQAPLAPSP